MHRNDLQFIKPVCRGRAYRRAFELPIINPKEINALSVDLEVQFLAYRSNFNIGDTFSHLCARLRSADEPRRYFSLDKTKSVVLTEGERPRYTRELDKYRPAKQASLLKRPDNGTAYQP